MSDLTKMKLAIKSRWNAKIETDYENIVIYALKIAKNNRRKLRITKKHYSKLFFKKYHREGG